MRRGRGHPGLLVRARVSALLKPPTVAAVPPRSRSGVQHVPPGPVSSLAANHISHARPARAGRLRPVRPAGGCRGSWPRASCSGAAGWSPACMRGAGQIPVDRDTADAPRALDAAAAALHAGELRRDLPGGHGHPRPRQVADAGPHRRGPAGAALRRAGRAGRPVGRRSGVHDDHAKQLPARGCATPGALPASASRSTCRACGRAGEPLTAERAARGDRPGHGRASRDRARRAARRARTPPAGSTRGRGRGGDAGGRRDARRRARRRARGARRSRRCSPTPAPTSTLLGPPARAGRGDPRRRTRTPTTCPGIRLPDARCRRPPTPQEALDGADFVVLAVPSQTLRDNLAAVAPALPPTASLLVSLMKGVELGTTKRMSEVIGEVADAPPDRVAVVSGPNLAREIAEEQPAATVVACTDTEAAAAAAGAPARRRTSGRTPTPTSSAASSAAR